MLFLTPHLGMFRFNESSAVTFRKLLPSNPRVPSTADTEISVPCPPHDLDPPRAYWCRRGVIMEDWRSALCPSKLPHSLPPPLLKDAILRSHDYWVTFFIENNIVISSNVPSPLVFPCWGQGVRGCLLEFWSSIFPPGVLEQAPAEERWSSSEITRTLALERLWMIVLELL